MRWFAACVVLASLPLGSPQIRPQDAARIHEQVIESVQKKLDAAIVAISASPEDPEAYHAAAEAQHLLGNLDDAMLLYQQMPTSAYSLPKPWYRMGLLFVEQNDLPAAEKMLQKAALLAGGDDEADSIHETLRLVRDGDFSPRSGGNYVDYGPLSVAFVGSGRDLQGACQMAMANIMQSKWQEAYEILRRAAQAGPQPGNAYEYAGVMNNIAGIEHRHVWSHALQSYRRALYHHGGRIEIWHNVFQITRFRFQWGYFHDFFPQLAQTCSPDLRAPGDTGKEVFGDMAAGASFLVCMSVDGNAPILEFGTFRGRSTYLMAKNSKDPNAQVYTVDIGKSMDFSAKNGETYPDYVVGDVFQNHAEPSVKSRVTQLIGDSSTMDFSAYTNSIGMVIVDGDHSYNGALSDISNALKMVKPGGYIVVDDYVRWWPGVLQAVDELARKHGLEFKYMIDKDLLFYHKP
jgi:predicted O-methyltransferase YrrM